MKEAEIRPQELFNQYLELSARDGAALDRSKFVEVDCPGCGSKQSPTQFLKNGYQYKKCKECNSLYCSPRPSNAQLGELYSKSESSHFWSNVFFPKVQEARREKLFRPKAQKVFDLIQKRGLKVETLCDVGAGHGLFLEELRPFFKGVKISAVEPDPTSAQVCRDKGFDVCQTLVEDAHVWEGKFDFVICSEVIEHVFDVGQFLNSLGRLLKPGGHCLITGLGYEGFDLLTLQEHSKAIFPPHHLNFLAQAGFDQGFKRNGFSNVDVWTPGVLDVDIVINSGIQNEFVEALKRRGPEAVQAFQKFLSENNLSSHVWVLAKK